MMRVNYSRWGSTPREMDLARALEPDASDGNDQIGRAQDDAESALRAVGRIMAALVEKRILTLEEAWSLSGKYGDLTPVEAAG